MNGRTIHVLRHSTLAEFKQVAEGIAGADRRARTNHGDPKDYTFDPNPPKPPKEPEKCPHCKSKHSFGRVKQHPERRWVKHYGCGRCGSAYLIYQEGDKAGELVIVYEPQGAKP